MQTSKKTTLALHLRGATDPLAEASFKAIMNFSLRQRLLTVLQATGFCTPILEENMASGNMLLRVDPIQFDIFSELISKHFPGKITNLSAICAAPGLDEPISLSL